MIPIIRDPAKVSDESDAVFYFPGCGSGACSPMSAWRRWRCCTKAAHRPCCRRVTCLRLPADLGRAARQGPEDHRQPGVVPTAWPTR